MRKISLTEIDETIKENRTEANHTIRQQRTSSNRIKKSRTRAKGEVEGLNQIAVARWRKAEEEGKIKRTGERALYYDYTE